MEHKYESDMTPKEKRQAEMEVIRSLKGKDKLEYLWMYYKIIYFLPFIIIGIIWFAIYIYGNIQEEVLLSVAVSDTTEDAGQKAEDLQDDLLKAIGSGSSNESIIVDPAVSSGDDSSSVTKRAVVLGTGNTDILICPRDLYRGYADEGAFNDWQEFLGADYEKYAAYITEDGLDLSKSRVWDDYGLTDYEPVCAGVLVTTEHPEQVKDFLEFLFP